MTVSLSRDGVFAVISLDDTERRNALSASLVKDLTDGLAACDADPDVRAVVLTHSGNTFCAGADLREPPDPYAVVGLLRKILTLDKPVVARVDGHVRAGGLGLLGVCDIAAAGPGSTFAFTEVRIGLAPAVISLPLLRRLDPAAASRWFLTGERFDAQEAARVGLVTLCGADVDEALVPVLAGLRKASPTGLTATKKLLTAKVLDGFDNASGELVDLSARLFTSEEAQEGMTSFLERRAPRWAR